MKPSMERNEIQHSDRAEVFVVKQIDINMHSTLTSSNAVGWRGKCHYEFPPEDVKAGMSMIGLSNAQFITYCIKTKQVLAFLDHVKFTLCKITYM